ncbi:nuclear transport factor 2 family protein [Seonamhaeicola sediminis]|uniref:Nuclear transport factor 2 family protein n=1 Tax=Seonamhaeicola sediminis TaxID=2528206 RepID=A0A562YC82_9FLAO|nr:nuclear transport factor 2 family protein [Seonamhaeicola sediminis]TWO32010.1 nuclear transport factor 2 family protein [Seonamhaeicola sediminis]
MKQLFFLIMVMLLGTVKNTIAQDLTPDQKIINDKLDDFHDAAKNADKKRYLSHFTKDAVYMGTDEWERWPLIPDFSNYVSQRFADGGWSYHSTNRNIYVSKNGKIAWFDEVMVSNNSGNRFRGSGVLRKENGIWKFTQYIQSFMIYNEIWNEVNKLMKQEKIKKEKN